MDDVMKLFESVGIEVLQCDPDAIALFFPSGHCLTITAESLAETAAGEYLLTHIEEPETEPKVQR